MQGAPLVALHYHYKASLHHELVVVIYEVGEPHEARASILREVAAHSAWISTCTGIKQYTELIVVHVVCVSSNLAQVLFHVYSELELCLNNLDQVIL